LKDPFEIMSEAFLTTEDEAMYSINRAAEKVTKWKGT
jgi:hypothetical protein